jgi:hypothetical protein
MAMFVLRVIGSTKTAFTKYEQKKLKNKFLKVWPDAKKLTTI